VDGAAAPRRPTISRRSSFAAAGNRTTTPIAHGARIKRGSWIALRTENNQGGRLAGSQPARRCPAGPPARNNSRDRPPGPRSSTSTGHGPLRATKFAGWLRGPRRPRAHKFEGVFGPVTWKEEVVSPGARTPTQGRRSSSARRFNLAPYDALGDGYSPG